MRTVTSRAMIPRAMIARMECEYRVLAAYVPDKFERERREIYIYDLAVADGHRRRGS